MKTYHIWKSDGTYEDVVAEKITWLKLKSGLKIKVDKRVIRNAVGLMEVSAPAPKAY